MGKKSSAVWKHFVQISGGSKCTITGCKDPIVLSAGSSTKGQWYHLEHNHKEIYDELEAEKLPPKRKPTDDGSTEKPAKKSKQENGETEIMKMLARRNVPFTLADDPLFRLMTTKTFGIANPIHSGQYARKVLPKVASEILMKLRDEIGDKPYAITTDGWSALNKPSPSLYR